MARSFSTTKSFSVRERFTSAAYRGQLAADLKDGKIDPSVLISAVSKSRHSGQSVVMLDVGNEHCRAMALHGGAGRGESLVICHLGELDPIDIRNLERSTVALSIAKLWSEKRETEQLIASSTLLRHLILVNPPDASTISAIRDRLKITTDQPVMLALIAISGLDRAVQTTMIREAGAKLNLLVDLVNDTYLAVGPERSIRALLQTLLRRRKDWEIGGIVSDPFSDLTQAAVQYAQIEQALLVLRKMNRLNRFVEHSQVNLFAKLFEVGDASRIARYVEQILAPIEERDPRQKTQLKKTLLCYIDSEHNIVRTAEILGVHVNTVRQRLDTLREITGGWDDPIAALELHVALRLDAITAPPEQAPSGALDDPQEADASFGEARQLGEFPSLRQCVLEREGRRLGDLVPAGGDRIGRPFRRVEIDASRLLNARHGEDAGAGAEDDPRGRNLAGEEQHRRRHRFRRKQRGFVRRQQPSVIAVAAVGASVLTRMPYFAPSRCSTFIIPIMAAFAAP